MAATQMVLVYDVEKSQLRQQQEFQDALVAAAEFSKLEREFRNRADVHVVMLSGESNDSIRATHGSYFREPFSFIRELDAASNGDGEPSKS